jgi:Domain of unknown function (DUF6948)
MAKTSADKTQRAVLVTTAHRGVFFGYEEARDGTTIVLRRARNCVRWSGTRGFLGLAEKGPNENCRVGPPAERLELLNITSIADVTPAAVDAWENAPWAR